MPQIEGAALFKHPISAIGVTAEIAEKSEEQLLSVHRKQFWALLLC